MFLFTKDYVINIETVYSDYGAAEDHLVVALNEGDPISDPRVVATFTADELAEILEPHVKTQRMPPLFVGKG